MCVEGQRRNGTNALRDEKLYLYRENIEKKIKFLFILLKYHKNHLISIV